MLLTPEAILSESGSKVKLENYADLSDVERRNNLKTLAARDPDSGKAMCLVCSMTFTTNQRLYSHIESKHIKVREAYKCEYCDYTCHSKPAWKMHTRRKHTHVRQSLPLPENEDIE